MKKTISFPACSGQKTCRVCNKTLPVVCFYVNRQYSDGIDTRCRECLNRANRTSKVKRRINRTRKVITRAQDERIFEVSIIKAMESNCIKSLLKRIVDKYNEKKKE